MYTTNTFEKVNKRISEVENTINANRSATSINLILKNFDTMEGKPFNVKGIVMSKRGLGKVIFMDIQDNTGTLQLYIRQDENDKNVFQNISKKVMIGDTICAGGIVMKTARGEISLKVKEFYTILPGSVRIEKTADNIYSMAKTGVKKVAHVINKFISEIN